MSGAVWKQLVVVAVAGLVACSDPESSPGKVSYKVGHLNVEVTPVEQMYSVARNGRDRLNGWEKDPNAFTVRFRVSNLDSTRYLFKVMTCSYCDQWKTDSADVIVCGWGCDSNYPAGRTLEPNGDYRGELHLLVRPEARGRE
jgi:hypothetical protein